MFVNSKLVLDMHKVGDKNPIDKVTADCMTTISVAIRIEAGPLMIMQNMTLIYGRPAWSSRSLIVIVSICGRFNPLQYRFIDPGRLGKVEHIIYDKIRTPGQNGGRGYCRNETKVEVFGGTQTDNIQYIAYTIKKGPTDILESTPVDVELAV